jgi:hypothetical protein
MISRTVTNANMIASSAPPELLHHWRTFLTKNPDARAIVVSAIARTGFNENEVLFFLVNAWAAQNLTEEQQREFYGSLCRVTMN